ncbi:MAG: glycosyltransferase [Candidatus Omnitrophica bacterium]|nr:glycosyltransferase [Candidatus Omnitrophota bacterium]
MPLYFLINSLAIGGAETVLVRIAKFLKPKEIFLLEKEIRYPVDKNSISFLSNHTRDTNSIFKTLYIPIYGVNLSKKIKSNDIVISFLERANFVNIVAKYIRRHRTIVSVQTDPISGHAGIRGINKRLIKTLYNKSDYVIAVSQGVNNSLISLGVTRTNIKVIYNPIFLEEIIEKSKEDIEEIFGGKDFLITVGRLTKAKGQWHLIRIFSRLKKEFPELKLLLLGDGELKDDLVNLSRNMGLNTYVWDENELSEKYDVYFMGFKENPFKYITKSKLFIFPSLWEGFGNVVAEALACKTVIVASDCKSGPREILAPDTDISYQTKKPEFAKYGVLMPVLEDKLENIEILTEKEITWLKTIKMLLKDENLIKHYREKALERAKDLDISKIIDDWYEVIQDVI